MQVEIGGDGQISCGAEPTPIKGVNGTDTNFDRGYETWLMTEAKQRNPDIVLMGLVYSFPWWVNPKTAGGLCCVWRTCAVFGRLVLGCSRG